MILPRMQWVLTLAVALGYCPSPLAFGEAPAGVSQTIPARRPNFPLATLAPPVELPAGTLTQNPSVAPVPGNPPGTQESPAAGKNREPGSLEETGKAPAAPSPQLTTGVHLEASWDNGFRLASADEQFHVHIGGNAQIDSTWLIAPKSAFALPSGATNGVENAAATLFRRVRLRLEGDLYDRFDYVVEYDLANANNENDGL